MSPRIFGFDSATGRQHPFGEIGEAQVFDSQGELCCCGKVLLAPGKSLYEGEEVHKRQRCWDGNGWWIRDAK